MLPTASYRICHSEGRCPDKESWIQVKFDGGTIRVNVFPREWTRVPKLDVELFYFFGKINMYCNFAARANLVSSPTLAEGCRQSSQPIHQCLLP